MHIVGRREEQRQLDEIFQSGKPEFVVVYGRRRVGKTYLVGEYFNQTFAFRAVGLATGGMSEQLDSFATSLREHGLQRAGQPRSWLEAFAWLRELLEDPHAIQEGNQGRLVVFIDQMPWFDTPRSGFKSALEYFWNGWGCTRQEIVLIACGSSSSWISSNLLTSTEGFYNRVTRILNLQPLTLPECREYLDWRGVAYSPRQVAECYMIFGGIPFYLDLQSRSSSLAQNVDALIFSRDGQLVAEFDRLFRTLFKSPEPYIQVVRKLAGKKSGLTRNELADSKLTGGKLTKLLSDLELCGFIRSYRDFTKRKNGKVFQLIDPFTLFHLTFVADRKLDDWQGFIGTPAYHAWAGLAFERLCLMHDTLIKEDLGIAGVRTGACAWRSSSTDPGAQIDLLIDRADGVVNLCEMKYSDGDYAMTAADERSVRNKMAAFRSETGTRKAIHPVLVTLDGARRNAHFDSVILREVRVADWVGR